MIPAAVATAVVVGALGYFLAGETPCMACAPCDAHVVLRRTAGVAGGSTFHPHACRNVEVTLQQHVVGQPTAVEQLTEAVCHHLSRPHSTKPLVISSHGPPGVGKTYSHLLLAHALYNVNVNHTTATRGPGAHCSGYKVGGGVRW